MIEVLILTFSIIVVVALLWIFSVLLNTKNVIANSYMGSSNLVDAGTRIKESLFRKFADWYFTRSAAPFWTVFIADVFIIIYSHLLGAYLVGGGETLVPYFWEYVYFSLGSLPFYFLGMRLYRTYETIARFSFAATLIRIICALVIGLLLSDLVKNLLPRDWVPVWPQWREQVITIVCAIVLMCCVRLMLKMVFDSTGHSKEKKRVFIFGTSLTSIELGLALQRDLSMHYEVVGYVRSNDKSPHCSLKDTVLYPNDTDLIENMCAAKVSTVIIPYSEYNANPGLADLLPAMMEQQIQVTIVP